VLLSLTVSLALSAQTRERAAGRTAPVTLVAGADVVAAYNALTALEPSQRKALYSALSNDVRAGLARLQHQMYLADHPALTADQRAVLNGLIATLTPEMYAPASPSATQIAGRAEMERLHQRAAELFTPDEMGQIFFRLGGDPAASHNWRVTVEADCDCAADDECGGLTCIFRGCTIIPHACGPDFAYACSGHCG
jgi:hypothetical protein